MEDAHTLRWRRRFVQRTGVLTVHLLIALVIAAWASAATVVSFVAVRSGETLIVSNPHGSPVTGQIRLIPDAGAPAISPVPFSLASQGSQAFPNVLAPFGPVTSPAILIVESSDAVIVTGAALHVVYPDRPLNLPVRFGPAAANTGSLVLGILNGTVRISIYEHLTSVTPLVTRTFSGTSEQVTRLAYADLLPTGVAIVDGYAAVSALSGQAVATAVNAPVRRRAAGMAPTPTPVLSIAGTPACEFQTGIHASVPAGSGATYQWTPVNATAQGTLTGNALDIALGSQGYATLLLHLVAGGVGKDVEATIRVDGKPSYTGSSATPATLGLDATIAWALAGGVPTSQALTGSDFAASVGLSPTATSYTYRPTTAGAKTYALSASNACGSGSSNGSYEVSAACTAPHIDSFTTGGPVCAGNSAQLTWATSGSGTVTIDHGVGIVAANGSLPVAPSVTTTYTITKATSCGSDSRTTTVTVGPGPVITNLTGPSAVGPGLSGTISFAYTNGTSFSFTSSLGNTFTPSGGSSTASGSITYSRDNAAGPDTITLAVTGPCGVTTRTLTIQDCAFADATMTAPASVCPLSTGNTASVPDAGPGWTYAWEVTNGTLTSGANSRAITFTAGSSGFPGFVQVRVRLQSSESCYENSEKAINISPAPDISSFTIDQSTVCPGANSTMRFTIANGTTWILQSALGNGLGPPSGSGTGNLTSTYIADSTAGNDVVTLTVSGACGTPATRTLNLTVPTPPVITSFTAPTSVGAGASAMISFAYTNGTSYSFTSSLGNSFTPNSGRAPRVGASSTPVTMLRDQTPLRSRSPR